MAYLLNKMTASHDRTGTLCFCLNATVANTRMTQLRDRHHYEFKDIDQLVLVINVGKLPDNSVYIRSDIQSGSHWVLAVVKLSTSEIFYCDSMTWGVPANLLVRIEEYTSFFNVRLSPSSIKVCHTPTPIGQLHRCQGGCTNYPIQRCSNVCGVVALCCAAVATFDRPLFDFLCGARTSALTYLGDPTRYAKYLRHVLISWFITGRIDIKNISLKEIPRSKPVQPSHAVIPPTLPLSEHTYAQVLKGRMQRKRKMSNYENKENGRPGSEKDTFQSHPSQPKMKVKVGEGLRLAQEEPVSEVHVSHSVNPKPRDLVEQRKIHSDGNDGKCDEKPAGTNTKDYLVSCETRKDDTTGQAEAPSKYVCPYCKLQLASRQSLHRHKKNKHADEKKKNLQGLNPMLQVQDILLWHYEELVGHLNSSHDHVFQIQQAEFASNKEYEGWKSDLESRMNFFHQSIWKQQL
ncbi:PREDICTED: uncharacterized protein LOC106814270 [Priapulus caudatus]|uniref:Uncharacterized protein LOC106814270 n=1 Tax=Priapulus caudatus TaxID=37621 RepID=A0ABM1EPD1_PRICU|nr:PREDICTED: uncharacterized protein LOC106814270 [Priapulus caudatus]